jgi:hypothetical protein
MDTPVASSRHNVAVTALLVGMLAMGCAMFMAPKAKAASEPYIADDASASCVHSVSPCSNVVSASLPVTQGDTIVVWSSDYPECNTPSAGSASDSAGDSFTPIDNNAFQFAACTPPGTLAIDYQGAYYSTAKATTTVTVSISYTMAPYEADLVVDDVSGGSFVSSENALCNGSESSQCIPNGSGTFGVSQFVAPSNSLILAYGSASSYMTIYENPLSPGPGYTTDQGPVYPGGYMLDSLTEYSTATAPTTAPIGTSTPTDGWGEIAIVLSGTSPVTVTVTQSKIITITTASLVYVTQTVQVVSTTTVSTTTTSTYTPPNLVPGVGNDTLVIAAAVISAAILISISLTRVASRRV